MALVKYKNKEDGRVEILSFRTQFDLMDHMIEYLNEAAQEEQTSRETIKRTHHTFTCKHWGEHHSWTLMSPQEEIDELLPRVKKALSLDYTSQFNKDMKLSLQMVLFIDGEKLVISNKAFRALQPTIDKVRLYPLDKKEKENYVK